MRKILEKKSETKLKIEQQGYAGNSYSFINAKQDFYTLLDRDNKREKVFNYIEINSDMSKDMLLDEIMLMVFDNGYWDKLYDRLKPSQIRTLKEMAAIEFNLA